MKVVLIGYRGTGKSAVCALLARRLGLRGLGMDAMIAERAGCSIPEIVRRGGWSRFRDLETEPALELAGLDRVVVDCGGGIVERLENLAALRTGARVFWLRASVETIVARIAGDAGRPPLTDGKSFTEEVAEVLSRRPREVPARAGLPRSSSAGPAEYPPQDHGGIESGDHLLPRRTSRSAARLSTSPGSGGGNVSGFRAGSLLH